MHLAWLKHQKAYKPYDIETHTSFVSRDVRLYENMLPFRDMSLPSH